MGRVITTHPMTDTDKAELADILAAIDDSKKRLKRFQAKLRQRAFQLKKRQAN